jgi:hypothetical protein
VEVTVTKYAVKPPADAKAARAGLHTDRKSPAAILVVHGMGQQIPFRTLDDVAEGVMCVAQCAPGTKPVARTVALGDERLSRLELTLRVGDADRDVHIYEAYWAPLTEGRVTIRDVSGFLLRAGLGGIKLGLSGFRRWLFDQYEEFEAPVRSAMYLVVALAVIGSLGFLNVLIVAIAAARAPLHTPPAWLGPAMFRDVTTALNFLVTAIAPFAGLMLVWFVTQRWKWRIPGWLTLPTFLLALWATLAAGVAAAVVVVYHAAFAPDPEASLFDGMAGLGAVVRRFDAWFDIVARRALIAVVVCCLIWSAGIAVLAIWNSLRKPQNSRGFTIAITLAFILLFASLGRLGWYLFQHARTAGGAADAIGHGLAWPLVVVVAAVVRSFLIQYAGDVAAYVQPQVVDRFYRLRQEIRHTVLRTARAVYAATEYDDIVLVGHSLGSVVMYDTLNRLLIDRELGGGGTPPEVASRTRLMLTFGSPLDKTAFIFGTQGSGSEAREALAASAQPLIERESVRPRWVNIYSRWDIISGPLDYYDRHDRSNRNPVENIKDDRASTLLAAHVEYWRNPKLFETVVAVLVNPST